MTISYGRTAYVSEVGAEMLDLIDTHLNTQATGNDLTVVDIEEVISFIDGAKDSDGGSYDENALQLAKFLTEVNDSLTGEYGDIFFIR